jgi:hypothetical protein
VNFPLRDPPSWSAAILGMAWINLWSILKPILRRVYSHILSYIIIYYHILSYIIIFYHIFTSINRDFDVITQGIP